MTDAHDDPTRGLGDEELVDGELLDEDAPEAVEAEVVEAAGPDPGASGGPRPDGVDAPGGTSGEGPAEMSFETLLADLERVASERDEYLDSYRRAQADFENFKKQVQRRAEDHVARSVSGLVERLLPVLDACDAALGHGATEVEPVAAALLGALEKEGLERLDPKGEPFDPAVADAVIHEPGEGGEHVVSEVMRAGYAWQGRVLRPAMVKVTD